MKRLVFLGALAWAQLSSPKSFVALSLGGFSPTGSTQAKRRLYPTDGYAQPGFSLGLHLQTFLVPYVGLNLRVTQSFFRWRPRPSVRQTASSLMPYSWLKPPLFPILSWASA
ncbi:MAG: hypothetical protein NZ958_07250 [Bacteroidia bacterium]|nr:hypothetical protein [Bacteroidia bacterium]MDW8088720.1 hypothetical protein [Bacteroidia bacterium]